MYLMLIWLVFCSHICDFKFNNHCISSLSSVLSSNRAGNILENPLLEPVDQQTNNMTCNRRGSVEVAYLNSNLT